MDLQCWVSSCSNRVAISSGSLDSCSASETHEREAEVIVGFSITPLHLRGEQSLKSGKFHITVVLPVQQFEVTLKVQSASAASLLCHCAFSIPVILRRGESMKVRGWLILESLLKTPCRPNQFLDDRPSPEKELQARVSMRTVCQISEAVQIHKGGNLT